MDKSEKKSFFSRLLNFKNKTNTQGKRLYSNSKQTTTKIKLALLDLLNNNEFSQINITNLVKVAGVYRATFYLHYKSLNDVLLDIERDVVEGYEAIRQQMKEVDLYENINVLIDKIEEYINIDKKYLGMIINADCFSRTIIKLRKMFNDVIISNFIKFGHIEQGDQLCLGVNAFTGGVVFILRDWIENENFEFKHVRNCINKLAICLLNKNPA